MRIRRILVSASVAISLVIICLAGVKLVLQGLTRTDLWFPLVLALGYLTALHRLRNWRAQMALSFFAVIAGLYSIEAVLQIAKPRYSYSVPPPGAPADYDLRSPIHVALEMREQGVDAFLGGHMQRYPRNEKYPGLIPLSEISHVSYVIPNENGQIPIHQTDEHGFFNTEGWTNLPAGKSIAILGDSFVQGCSVEMHETISARLNTRLKETGYRSVSLGQNGSGPLCNLGRTVEFLREVKPRYVFWCYYEGNDLIDLTKEFKTDLKRYLEDPAFHQDLRNRQAEVDEYLTEMLNSMIPVFSDHSEQMKSSVDWRWITLKQLRTKLNYLLQTPRFPVEQEWISVFSRILDRAKSEVESWGGELVFVYLPSIKRYGAPRTLDYEAMHQMGMDCARQKDLPVIDLHHEMFLPSGDPLSFFPFRYMPHYTPSGYDGVAEAMWRHLEPLLTKSAAPGDTAPLHN